MDDLKVKRRAGKFREFLENNNERPTKIFFRLGKEKGGDDDITQIRDDRGVAFVDGKQREKYINDFYGQLYKKRLDRLISIEDFLDRAGDDADIQSKKLSEGERRSLEGKVTLDELEKSLAKSNMNSACVL